MIDGTITANGRVFIINRDGMLFGRNAVINTAGFLATTNDIRNADFMAGRMNFNIPGRGNASIVNFGNITASSGGFAALVAPGVRNAGTISANLGTVALASGNSFTLDMYGDKLIQVAVGDEIADKVIDVSTGKPLSSLVTNEGTLRANGGRVEITAAAARHIVELGDQQQGRDRGQFGRHPQRPDRARRRHADGGAAEADDQGLRQDQRHRQGQGPEGRHHPDHRRGHPVRRRDARRRRAIPAAARSWSAATTAAAGRSPAVVNNQSAVLEGYAIATASTVTVDSATTFNASATANGNGGKVILWSDVLTTFAGTIFARGGEQGGNGGFVEVSGKQQLAYTGLVDTRAPQRTSGHAAARSGRVQYR